MTLTDTLDHLLSVFLRPLRTWIEREFIAPWRAAYDAAMQTKEQYRDGVYLHLKERLEGTDEKPLAEGVPVRPLPTTQDLEHLQSALEMLDTRKVDVYEADDIPDGEPFAKLLVTPYLGKYLVDRSNYEYALTYRNQYLYANVERCYLPVTSWTAYNDNAYTISMPMLKSLHLPKLVNVQSIGNCTMIGNMPDLEEIIMPNFVGYGPSTWGGWATVIGSCAMLKKVVFGKLTYSTRQSNSNASIYFPSCPMLIHFEVGNGVSINMQFDQWSPTMALREDTTASDYIDLREDKDEQGEFINATNLEQFLANFRKYIILRLANRTGDTALTLTLSAAVYQSIYGLDSSNNADNNSWARTHTLSDLGLTADDLTEAETASGITINTIYATWLDTYRSAINWNIGH